MVLTAALPLALKPDTRSAAVIGIGTGLTTHTLLQSLDIEPPFPPGRLKPNQPLGIFFAVSRDTSWRDAWHQRAPSPGRVTESWMRHRVTCNWPSRVIRRIPTATSRQVATPR